MPDDSRTDGGGVTDPLPKPWLRRNRRLRLFVVRITIAVTVGIGWAECKPLFEGYTALAQARGRAGIPPERWPYCHHLTPHADACWYAVRDTTALTIDRAASALDVSTERLTILNPDWTSSKAPEAILIWRGAITREGRFQ